MKHLISLLLIIATTSLTAQIKGNKKIVTTSFDLNGITSIDVGLYAEIDIDMAAPEGITITIDQNLLDYVDKSVIDRKLTLDQKEWISPSQNVIIKIGAPLLQYIQQGTHETTLVKNIDSKQFNAMANVGRIVLEGRTSLLHASGEVGEVDARSLETEKAEVNLWGWGSIYLNRPNEISGKVKEDGNVIYEGGNPIIEVRTSSGGRIKSRSAVPEKTNPQTKYINIKLKNNSSNRINAYVRGPKPDGKFFSYGFPMRPGQVKKERWTIGTKVFRKTNLGLKKLLVEVKAEDEGEVVRLYK